MTYLPPSYPSLGCISTRSRESCYDLIDILQTAESSNAWPQANFAIYLPFSVGEAVTATHMAWRNGGTVSGNVDAGIYDSSGTKLRATGSTAQSGTTAIQTAALTSSLSLSAGVYYMALVLDNTTGTIAIWSAGTTDKARGHGIQNQATAFTLPSTATFANPTSLFMPEMAVLPHGVL